jgi:hypothetical protein
MLEPFNTRYREWLTGALSYYDRIVITGIQPGACYTKGMTSFLNMHGYLSLYLPVNRTPPRMRS